MKDQNKATSFSQGVYRHDTRDRAYQVKCVVCRLMRERKDIRKEKKNIHLYDPDEPILGNSLHLFSSLLFSPEISSIHHRQDMRQ